MVGLLSSAFLSVDLGVKPVELFLDVLCELGGVLLAVSALGLNVLFEVEDSVFHLLADHVYCLALLVGDLL